MNRLFWESNSDTSFPIIKKALPPKIALFLKKIELLMLIFCLPKFKFTEQPFPKHSLNKNEHFSKIKWDPPESVIKLTIEPSLLRHELLENFSELAQYLLGVEVSRSNNNTDLEILLLAKLILSNSKYKILLANPITFRMVVE